MTALALGFLLGSLLASAAQLWAAKLGNNHPDYSLGVTLWMRLFRVRPDPADVYAGCCLAVAFGALPGLLGFALAVGVTAAYVKWGEPLLYRATGDPYFTMPGVPFEAEDVRDVVLGFVPVALALRWLS